MRELSLHILDLLENALEAGATQVEVSIEEDLIVDQFTITVRDNGQGMDSVVAQRALDPFFTTRTTRHVGLGLPLLASAARRCDGSLTLESAVGRGTMVKVTFQHGHLDRAPLGNITGTLLAFLLSRDGRAPQLHYRHRISAQLNDKSFDLDTTAIQAELGTIPLSYPPVRTWLHDYIAEGEAALASSREGGYSAKAEDN